MDADTRPNSAVMAYVGPRGATAAYLRERLGWPWERLEAVLRDLKRSRVLVQREGRWFAAGPANVPVKPTVFQERRVAAAKKALAAYLEKSRERREQKYTEILKLRAEGLSYRAIAALWGRDPGWVRAMHLRAVRWRAGGGE